MDADYWIKKLKLEFHSQAQLYFKVGFITAEALNFFPNYHGRRPLSASIYYLLQQNKVIPFHYLRSERVCHYYAGNTDVKIYGVQRGKHQIEMTRLGLQTTQSSPQRVIYSEQSCALELDITEPESYALIGMTFVPTMMT